MKRIFSILRCLEREITRHPLAWFDHAEEIKFRREHEDRVAHARFQSLGKG